MKDLYQVLKKENYKKVQFKITKTQHLLIKAKLNGVLGNFILDTGASTSCIGFESVDLFLLNPKKSDTKASGAGATGMLTQIASKNHFQLGNLKVKSFDLVVFDLSHVNEALMQHKANPVHGIIGADILVKGKAIVDYYNRYLYLLE